VLGNNFRGCTGGNKNSGIIRNHICYFLINYSSFTFAQIINFQVDLNQQLSKHFNAFHLFFYKGVSFFETVAKENKDEFS